MSVVVTVLHFDGCPSWQTAIERVHAASARTGVRVTVSTRAVGSTEDADRLGFTGSPTILLNGTDPFAQPGDVPALACRVYATPDGLAGSPTVDQLVDALTQRPA
ncbi:MAG: thioredoxin family protein [Pedococcus sp.]